MPQIFKIGSFWIYFWANENKPLEPIIPDKKLKMIIRIIEANSDEVIEKWKEFFGEVRYYC